MRTLITFWRKLRSLGQPRAVKQEIDEELRFHIEQRTAENITKGMTPEEAAREARKRFGNLQSVREECRELRGGSFGETILQDIRFGLRMLRKNPAFTSYCAGRCFPGKTNRDRTKLRPSAMACGSGVLEGTRMCQAGL